MTIDGDMAMANSGRRMGKWCWFLFLGSVAAAVPTEGRAQQAAAPLVLQGVTVVDVEAGQLRPAQTVVIVGNHIQALGGSGAVKIPTDARVVDARGKYLIPGLWDLHVHPMRATRIAYPRFIANGVTGIRDAGSSVPLDTLRLWRGEILAGARVGPPRQLLSGHSIGGPFADCDRSKPRWQGTQTCVADSADAVHYVDSLKTAGADMIKPREVDRALYFAIAAEARRIGIPFGGHASFETEFEASDSGARIIDHAWGDAGCGYESLRVDPGLVAGVIGGPDSMDKAKELGSQYLNPKGFQPGDEEWESCQKLAAARFWHNGTWFVPTFDAENPYLTSKVWQAGGMPIVAGTDDGDKGGDYRVSLHELLATYVAKGMTPLDALRTTTLNPAKMLHAADSLGSVASGKLADLVVLDANPLVDIHNTTTIRAVIANGRYFDRAALDRLLAQIPTDPSTAALAPAGP